MRTELEKKVLQVIRKAAGHEVERIDHRDWGGWDWPPICSALIHQPRRPGRKKE